MIQGKSYSTGQVDGLKYVEIPKGWSRILENGSVLYVSPSSSHLKSYEHVIEYLKAEGTCKCGLDCPFFVHRVFNFDASVQNKEQKDELPNKDKSSICKLCDKNGPKGKSLVDQMLLQKQPLKQSMKKPAKFSPFDGNLTSKKVISRSRPKLSDGPKAKKARKVSSPLSDIPSPPPIPISSPVQNVPNNIGTLNQGPLPSFASIVSSSKFFNPGPNRGPLHPTGSLPLKTNNEFIFPKPVSTVVTTSTASIAITTTQAIPLVSEKKPSMSRTFSLATTCTTVPTTTSSTLSSISKLHTINNVSTVPTPATSTSSTISVAINVSTPKLSESVCKPAVVPIISTPSLPSAFAPLDGLPQVSTDAVKLPSKPVAKPKSRSRPTSRSKPKPKSDNSKSKFAKGIGNTAPMIPGAPLTAVISSPVVAAATTFPVSSHWSVPVPSVVNTVGHMPYQAASPVVTTVTSVAKNTMSTSLVTSSYVTGNSISRPPTTQSALQATIPPSVYMTAGNFQNQVAGQAIQMASIAGPNLQSTQGLTTPNQSTSSVGNGKDSVVISPTIATASNTYPVVATPRIQPPPGMMYVATAPGVGMFPANYPYLAASAQQLQISQASYSQPQSKSSSSTTTTATSTNQQPVTQGLATDAGQGKVSFQVPGMYVQGAATNQMFPLSTQGFNVNQYKGAYQLQNAMYQGGVPGGAMAFIAPNGAKATYPGIQTMATGNIGQFAYTNPYMFGIVMTTSTNQPSSVSVSSTRSSPATQTNVTTSLQMIQPQGIQNPAIAAAFESFVPIAPAAGGAAPRFAQTLAHLASAYNAFPASGLVQGPNPNQLHLAYQMMQMNPHSSTQQVASLGGMVASDGSLKNPVAASVKQGQTTSVADTNKGGVNTQSKGHSVAQSPTSSASPVSTIAQDNSGGIRSFVSPPITASTFPISSPPCTSATVSVTQAHLKTKSDSALHNEKHLQTQSQDKCLEPVSKGNSGIESSCSDTQNLFHETNKTANLSSNSASQGIKPVITAIDLVSTDHSNSLAVSQSPSHHSISPLQNQQQTLTSTLSEDSTSKIELSSEVKSQKYLNQVDHDNLSPVRTPNFPVEQKLMNFSNEKTGASNSHRSQTPPKQINSCPKGGVLSDMNTPTRTLENREPITPTNYVDKVNYYETNPLLGMKRSCEAIEVYPDPPENPNCTEDDKEDYYSSNEESLEEHPFGKDDTTSDIVVDHRQGEDRHVDQEPYRISNQVHNTAVKDLYNGGCNETRNESAIQNKFPSIKPSQTFVGDQSFRPEMFGDLSLPHIRPHFDVGDVVWAQARGLPSWPGKIVDESKVGKGKADDGKKWVMWFGDHTFSQVEVDRLKTLNDGLRTLDDKARKKKYRAKKARISLEQAISEALEELEMRKQLQARQAAMRPKTKKKRLR